MGLPQMLTTVQVARLFGAETPEEIKTRQAYLAQLRFRGQGPRFVKHGRMILYSPNGSRPARPTAQGACDELDGWRRVRDEPPAA